ncbi:hypothetical protein LLH00_01675 [bacterium]|nr:hypothetical protein [bacterium]
MDVSTIASAWETTRVGSTSAVGSAAPPAEDENANVTTQEDTVDISPEAKDKAEKDPGAQARGLLESLNILDGFSPEALKEKSTALKEDLDELFQRAGIDTSTEISLTTGYDGSVLVSGEHPDKAKIEKLFADNPELANRFREVSGMASMIRACQEGIAFQKAYAQDPEAAVAQYSYLFNDNYQPQFNMSYTEDSMSFYFTDLFHQGRQYLEY